MGGISERAFMLTAGVVLLASVAMGGRPLSTDDADPIDVGQVQAEIGVPFERYETAHHVELPFAITCGVVRDVQITAGFGGILERRTEVVGGTEMSETESGIGDFVVTAKWQFFGGSGWVPRQAVVPTVKFPTADTDKGFGSGEYDYDLTWISSRTFNDKTGVHLDVGYTVTGGLEGSSGGDVFHSGIAADYRISSAVQWVGETIVEKELVDASDVTSQFLTGIRWFPSERLMVDVAGGSKISGDAPDLVLTAGLTYTFAVRNSTCRE